MCVLVTFPSSINRSSPQLHIHVYVDTLKGQESSNGREYGLGGNDSDCSVAGLDRPQYSSFA